MLRQIFVVADDHAAFAGCHQFEDGKTETSKVSPCPHIAAFVLGSLSLRAVFDNYEVMLLGDGHDCIHLTAIAANVNGNDCFRSRCDRPLNGLWIDTIVVS